MTAETGVVLGSRPLATTRYAISTAHNQRDGLVLVIPATSVREYAPLSVSIPERPPSLSTSSVASKRFSAIVRTASVTDT
jgi:hypothetical protein